MAPKSPTIRTVVFTPNDAVTIALRSIEERRGDPGAGVRVGLSEVDSYLLPARPGELISVLGMTSNYKSGWMQFWARQAAAQIAEYHLHDQVVIYASWEQAIEEMMAFDLAFSARMSATQIYQGRVSENEMQRLREAALKRICIPIWLIGHSIEECQSRPMLSLRSVNDAVNYIRSTFAVKPRIIFLDYLQQIEPDEGENRRMQVFDIVRRCKNLALSHGCPVVMGVQAGRDVYNNRSWGVPGVHEALETSNIEHTSDKILGIWYPKQSFQEGTPITARRKGRLITLNVSENLLILQVLKQKMGPSGLWWPLYVDPATNQVSHMLEQNLNDWGEHPTCERPGCDKPEL